MTGADGAKPGAPAGLAVVVIGRNEGDRLVRCLESLAPDSVPVVYVDSGSTDGSADRARRLGAEVIELDSARPFSAARARNEGLDRCLSMNPATWAVMFVDGDCTVDPGWLARAAAELNDRPELAVVCGRLREIDPGRSIFNRLADLEWDAPLGLVEACGGIAVYRVADFYRVGGFDAAARAGEEPELCRRLRAAGRLVARIDAPMARHDLHMTRLAQWWRRQERFGYHGLALERQFAAPIGLDGRPMPSLFGDAIRRSRIWGIGWPVLVVAGVTGSWLASGPIAALAAGVLGLAILALQTIRLAWRVRSRVRGASDALAYGALMLLDKWANLAGQAHYLLDRRAGRGPRLIEYRTLGAGASPVARSAVASGRGGDGLTAGTPEPNDRWVEFR